MFRVRVKTEWIKYERRGFISKSSKLADVHWNSYREVGIGRQSRAFPESAVSGILYACGPLDPNWFGSKPPLRVAVRCDVAARRRRHHAPRTARHTRYSCGAKQINFHPGSTRKLAPSPNTCPNRNVFELAIHLRWNRWKISGECDRNFYLIEPNLVTLQFILPYVTFQTLRNGT